MKIAMVSEHASPLAALGEADAGGQNVHVAELALGPGPAGSRGGRLHPPGRPAAARARATRAGRVRRPRAGRPGRATCPRTTCWRRWTRSPTGWPTTGRAPATRRSCTRTSGCPGSRPCVPAGSAGCPSCRPSTRSAASSSATRAPRTRAPPSGSCSSSRWRPRSRWSSPPAPTRSTSCARWACRPTTCAWCPAVSTPHTSPRWAVSRACSRPRGGPRLLAVGRLVERKGFDLAVRALADLPDAELVVVGGPPADQLGPTRRPAGCVASRPSSGSRTGSCSPGSCRMPSCRRYYRCADVVLAVPWYEPFGITPLEAAACGRPLVGAAVGGLLDSVDDGVTGRLVPPA